MLGEAFIALITEIIIVLTPIVIGFLIRFLKEKIGKENMQKIHEAIENKKELADSAVRFAEQAFKDLGGQAKYDQAVTYFVNRAKDNRLKVTDEEVSGLIESAVQKMNSELRNKWNQTIQ